MWEFFEQTSMCETTHLCVLNNMFSFAASLDLWQQVASLRHTKMKDSSIRHMSLFFVGFFPKQESRLVQQSYGITLATPIAAKARYIMIHFSMTRNELRSHSLRVVPCNSVFFLLYFWRTTFFCIMMLKIPSQKQQFCFVQLHRVPQGFHGALKDSSWWRATPPCASNLSTLAC